jgi:NAD(P)-dependent dehydrogenase (short-subunit alcohol dehydrogenase family)
MKDLKCKVAVVTGAASGIGKALAKAFAAEDMKVVLADIEADRLAAVEKEIAASGAETLSHPTDVTQKDQIEALADKAYERFGAVHILCNNAGVTSRSDHIWAIEDKDWAWVTSVNFYGVLYGLQVFVPRMIEGGEEGVIMNTCSFVGLSTGTSSPYGVTKHALTRMTEGLHYDLKAVDSKLRAALLLPGAVASDFGLAERNRPAALMPERDAEAEKEAAGRRQRIHNWLQENGMPADEVARIALEAIRQGQFYILTEPEDTKARLVKRMEGILEGTGPLD